MRVSLYVTYLADHFFADAGGDAVGPRVPGELAPALLIGAGLALACAACGNGDPPAGPGGLPPVPEEATAWLGANALPLETTDPGADPSDLEPLRQIVGDARIVALGEATHGTREFFRLKHRMVRFLVREMGFDAVALEAPWAESNRVNDWVLGAEGDPEALLSGLYGWHVNTREILEMVRWMREWNASAGENGVRFSGFDMQHPGMAIENVKRFVGRVDPESLGQVSEGLECMERFANDPTGAFPEPGYREQLREAYRIPCRESLEGVRTFLEEREAEYAAASSPEAFARALRSIRVVLQFEEHASALTGNVRDRSMAENVGWILERLGPGGRMVVWAHNDHVVDAPGSMARALERRHGQELVKVGLAFFRGAFNAEGPGSPAPEPHTVGRPVAGSYGHYFGSAELPRFFLDLRERDYSAPGASWIPGPRPLRSIGLDFDPGAPRDHLRDSRLPEELDVIAYVHESTPSTLLPFRYPAEF